MSKDTRTPAAPADEAPEAAIARVMADFAGSVEAREFTERLLDFLLTEIRPREKAAGLKWDDKADHDFLREIWRLSAERGFYGTALPKNLGGAGLSTADYCALKEFEATISPSIDCKPVPDISGLRKPVEIAQEIADEVMDELDKFSRFLGRNPDGRGSVEGHALYRFFF